MELVRYLLVAWLRESERRSERGSLVRCPGCGEPHAVWCLPSEGAPREFDWSA